MFILGNFLSASAQILDVLITVLWWMIIIRALLSWVNPDPFNPIVVFLIRVTEPILQPFRKLVPSHAIGIDVSPILAILTLLFLRYFLVKTLMDLSYRLS